MSTKEQNYTKTNPLDEGFYIHNNDNNVPSSEKEFVTYQKFSDKQRAIELSLLLTENKILHQLEDASARFDPSFVNSELEKDYRVKLRKADFEQADSLLQSVSAKAIEALDKDYYLFSFSDKELMEVVNKRDEWNNFDYVLAQKLLSDRGHEVKEELLVAKRKQRMEELAKPEVPQKRLIVAGYLFAILGGLIGIFLGWHLQNLKKTLPNGERVYAYSKNVRTHGGYIFYLGILILLVTVLYKVGAKLIL